MLSPFVLRRQNQLFHARAQLFIFYLMPRLCNKTFSSASVKCLAVLSNMKYGFGATHTARATRNNTTATSRPNFVAIWTRERPSKIDGWIVCCAHSLVYHNPAPGVFDRARACAFLHVWLLMKFISTCFLIIDEIHACRSRTIITGSPECEVKEAHLSQLDIIWPARLATFLKD